MREELLRPPDEPAKPGGAAAWIVGAWIGGLVATLIVSAWVLGKDEGKRQAEEAALKRAALAPARATPAPTTAAVPAGPGKQLFATKCGSCHTLQAAATNATVGPNLDELRPDAAGVQAAIQNGGAGSGAMPKGLAQGEEAAQIADFVSKAAGG
jgi:mono/diheme cytochrome c family protein